MRLFPQCCYDVLIGIWSFSKTPIKLTLESRITASRILHGYLTEKSYWLFVLVIVNKQLGSPLWNGNDNFWTGAIKSNDWGWWWKLDGSRQENLFCIVSAGKHTSKHSNYLHKKSSPYIGVWVIVCCYYTSSL